MTRALFVVFGIGLAVAIVQMVLLRRCRAEIQVRCRVWLDECRRGQYQGHSRGEAVTELERLLGLAPFAAALRRVGVMAPLLGVVLTTGSIIASQSDQARSGTRAFTMPELAPLLAGVSVGAVLAIINQYLLILVRRFEDREMRVVIQSIEPTWFSDTADRLGKIVSGIDAAGIALGSAIAQLSTASTQASVVIDQLGSALQASTERLGTLTGQLKAAVHEPAKDFVAAASELSLSSKTVATSYRTMTDTMQKLGDLSVTRLESMLDKQARQQQDQVEAVGVLSQASEKLRTSISALTDVRASEIREQFALAASSATSLAEAGARAASTIESTGSGFAERLQRATEQAEAALSRFESVLSRLDARTEEAAAKSSKILPSETDLLRVRDGIRELADASVAVSRQLRDAELGGNSDRLRTRTGFLSVFGGTRSANASESKDSVNRGG